MSESDEPVEEFDTSPEGLRALAARIDQRLLAAILVATQGAVAACNGVPAEANPHRAVVPYEGVWFVGWGYGGMLKGEADEGDGA